MSTEVENVFSNLGIPPAVRNAYQSLGLKSLYEWQRDCLFSTNVLRGENLVYCAPTSGGKTLIAELVLLKVALCLRKKVTEVFTEELRSSFTMGHRLFLFSHMSP